MKAFIVVVLVAACSGSGSSSSVDSSGGGNEDAKVFMDAPPSVPAMITISGTAGEGGLSGTTPVSGVAISIYRTSDEGTAIGTAMTNAQGTFSIMVATNGVPCDCFIKAVKTGSSYMTSYAYPSAPLIANSSGNDLNMITQSNFNLLSSFAGGNQMAGKGVIALAVLDSSNMPVAGATVASTPASNPYRYNGSNGYPSSDATATASDGFAYMFNVPGKVTISASKAGMTFHAHAVNAHPDAFTSTSIAP